MVTMVKKKILLTLTLLVVLVIGFAVYKKLLPNHKTDMFTDGAGLQYMAKVDGEYFYLYRDQQWQKAFVKGVNIGASKPGYFPGEFGISKADYLRWFKYIAEMHANTIRVYTILKPDFYNALYEFNQTAARPLYLLQGVWINEENIALYHDAYQPLIADGFKKDIETVIDVLHGQKNWPSRRVMQTGFMTKMFPPMSWAIFWAWNGIRSWC